MKILLTVVVGVYDHEGGHLLGTEVITDEMEGTKETNLKDLIEVGAESLRKETTLVGKPEILSVSHSILY